MKTHYFRDLFFSRTDYETIIQHDDLPGTHGNNPKYCKACVRVIVAIEEHQADDSRVFVGVAIRNPKDPFNRKIGRAIAQGRLAKLASYNISFDKAEIKNLIEESYQYEHNFALVDEWNYVIACTTADLKEAQQDEKYAETEAKEFKVA